VQSAISFASPRRARGICSISTIQPKPEPVLKEEASKQVPEWIKNNAEWWSVGQIDDATFVTAIQYLIKEKILNIQDLPEISSQGSKQIPEWIKTVAGYWSDDMISEEDFIMSIKYLIENGIIQIT